MDYIQLDEIFVFIETLEANVAISSLSIFTLRKLSDK